MSSKYQDTWDNDDWRDLQQDLETQEERDQQAHEHTERPDTAKKVNDGSRSERSD